MTPWTMGLNILYGIGIAAIFGLSIVLEQSGVLSLAYVLGVLLFVFDLFGPLKALYGEASRLTVMNAALKRYWTNQNFPTMASSIFQLRHSQDSQKSSSTMLHLLIRTKRFCIISVLP